MAVGRGLLRPPGGAMPQGRGRITVVVPRTLSAPGPGRSPPPSMTGLPDEGTQNVPAIVVSKGLERSRPAGEPVSLIVPASPPNAPGCAWPGQKFPSGSDAVAVSVVRPARVIVSRPRQLVSLGGHSIAVFLDPTQPLHGEPARSP